MATKVVFEKPKSLTGWKQFSFVDIYLNGMPLWLNVAAIEVERAEGKHPTLANGWQTDPQQVFAIVVSAIAQSAIESNED